MATPIADRFWSKVREDESGCWLWTAGCARNGYGQFSIVAGDARRAHRFAYEQMVGQIPDGLEIDHLCRVRTCVNPAHLEPVTHAENMLRAAGSRTHCPHGHEYTPDNLVRSSRGRRCRTCHNASMRAAKAARRAVTS